MVKNYRIQVHSLETLKVLVASKGLQTTTLRQQNLERHANSDSDDDDVKTYSEDFATQDKSPNDEICFFPLYNRQYLVLTEVT